MARIYPFFLALLYTACSPSLEDQIEKLAGKGDEFEEAKKELLVATDQAVQPLLESLQDPHLAAARPEIVDVLSSLLARLDDQQIFTVLQEHLRDDPDPRVRARIAYRMGVYKRQEAIPTLLEILKDKDSEVRYQALVALDLLEGKLNQAHKEILKKSARELLADPHQGVRLEATIRVENFVQDWIREARELELKAQLQEAEATYHKALAYSPTSKQANFRLGLFYFANQEREQGLELLRRHGLLLDVPLLNDAPIIDGRLDEAFWQQAARADTFSQVSHYHNAVLPSQVLTTI